MIRIPTKALDQCRAIARAKHEFYNHHGRYPSDEELSGLLGISLKVISKASRYHIRIDRLEDPLDSESDLTLGDMIASEPEPEEDQDLIRKVRETIIHLTLRERKVLEHRFGIGPHDALTLENIGNIIGVTRERVRQIESRAITKLRKLADAKGLRMYLEGK